MWRAIVAAWWCCDAWSDGGGGVGGDVDVGRCGGDLSVAGSCGGDGVCCGLDGWRVMRGGQCPQVPCWMPEAREVVVLRQ